MQKISAVKSRTNGHVDWRGDDAADALAVHAERARAHAARRAEPCAQRRAAVQFRNEIFSCPAPQYKIEVQNRSLSVSLCVYFRHIAGLSISPKGSPQGDLSTGYPQLYPHAKKYPPRLAFHLFPQLLGFASAGIPIILDYPSLVAQAPTLLFLCLISLESLTLCKFCQIFL